MKGELIAVEKRIQRFREPGKPADEPKVKYHELVRDEESENIFPEKISEEEFLEYFREADYEDIETFKDKSKHGADPVAPDKITDIQVETVTKINMEADN